MMMSTPFAFDTLESSMRRMYSALCICDTQRAEPKPLLSLFFKEGKERAEHYRCGCVALFVFVPPVAGSRATARLDSVPERALGRAGSSLAGRVLQAPQSVC